MKPDFSPSAYRKKTKKVLFKHFSVFISASATVFVVFFLFHIAQAVFYNASGMIGYEDQSNNPVYNVLGTDDGPSPQGFSIDTDNALDAQNHRLFVADDSNNRVLVFALDSSNNISGNSAAYVLGQNNFYSDTATTTQNGMSSPAGVAYDPTNERLFVSDANGNRVLVFDVSPSDIENGENAEAVLGQTDYVSNGATTTISGFNTPSLMAYDDSNSRLFVTDYNNNRVLVFDASTSTLESTPTGESAEAVLGQSDYVSSGNATTPNGLYTPASLAYDPATYRLFVGDVNNNRVLVFDASTSTLESTPTGESAENVLGQTDFYSNNNGHIDYNQSKMTYPTGLAYDQTNDRLFVADQQDARVMVFNASSTTMTDGELAENVLGQSSYFTNAPGTSQNSLASIVDGLTYDQAHSRLFVVDNGNDRVMVFNADPLAITNGENAESALGHVLGDDSINYNSSGPNNGPNPKGFLNPQNLALDTVNHRLFVTDMNNNRVLVFNLTSSNELSQTTASYVLGQNDFYSNVSTTTQNGLHQPSSLAFDQSSNRLFVTDTGNNRILVFDVSPAHISNGENAENILGQSDYYSSGDFFSGGQGFNYPAALALDPTNERLFVADENNYRVLEFNVAIGSIGDNESADHVLGAADFNSNYYYSSFSPNNQDLNDPLALGYDSANQRLFVSDKFNRVMVFDVPTNSDFDGVSATAELGQPDFSSQNWDISQSALTQPSGLSYDPNSGRLFVANQYNYSVMIFDASVGALTSTPEGENAENILGENDFNSQSYGTNQYQFSYNDSPADIIYDPSDNILFAADTDNNRVLMFSFINITTGSLPGGTSGTAYSQTLNTQNSQGTVSFTVSSGALPEGLSLNDSTGEISGTPTLQGPSSFTIQADDTFSTGAFTGSADYTIDISAGSGGGGGGNGGGGGGGTVSYGAGLPTPLSTIIIATSTPPQSTATPPVIIVTSTPPGMVMQTPPNASQTPIVVVQPPAISSPPVGHAPALSHPPSSEPPAPTIQNPNTSPTPPAQGGLLPPPVIPGQSNPKPAPKSNIQNSQTSQPLKSQGENNAAADTLLLALAVLPILNIIRYLVALRPIISINTWPDLQLALSRQWQSFLIFFGFKPKPNYWGTVYDSQNKQPLDPAVVELVDADSQKIVGTAITDLLGRFGFLIKQGNFLLRSKKTHYEFPSKKITGPSDGIYQNLYHGETLVIDSQTQVLSPNIPMDPLAFDWNQQDKQRLVKFHPRLETFLNRSLSAVFWLGCALSLYEIYLYRDLKTTLLFVLFIVIGLLSYFWPKQRLWGQVRSSTQSNSGLLIELCPMAVQNVVMAKATTSSEGVFFLKANPGKYLLRIIAQNGAQPKEPLKTLAVKVGKSGVFNKQISLN
jgi:DNA-binding beta-propeller fold protein YncE